ncbi:hypothetical protein PRN20_18705 [Devosia sp. ZB163]|uniref:hypothetical protein n=1 Tax=Devosia sp. ZB163 TaxID=3025938 RepID=UPI0023607059|nr:hypothetical protein [Devosia sp. ZB163]MDC9825770.1 hypothetical protein [Devosia sp. ZB163]
MRKSTPQRGIERHGLPGRLIVSLTSYPDRYATLSLTIKCLLSQSVLADCTVLWVSAEDARKLPEDVLALRSHGLTIAECDDIGSYKKIIPALRAYADCNIVTADDDHYYPPDWLATLVRGQHERPGAIACHTARVIQFGDQGELLQYRFWPLATTADKGPLLPTGYGGILYPPGSLPEETLDETAFRELSPTADDLWLRWMSGRRGVDVHMVPDGRPLLEWHGSQRLNLLRYNIYNGGNDRQIKRLVERYGLEFLRV